MILSAIAHVFSALLELIRISRMSDHDKDLEILVLRYQLGIADRRLNRHFKPAKSEKLTLAVLVNRLKRRTNRTTNDLRASVRIFTPRTVIRWHNELVKRKWTYKHTNKGGRPRINKQIENLMVRLAQENGRWGYGKIAGELIKDSTNNRLFRGRLVNQRAKSFVKKCWVGSSTTITGCQQLHLFDLPKSPIYSIWRISSCCRVMPAHHEIGFHFPLITAIGRVLSRNR